MDMNPADIRPKSSGADSQLPFDVVTLPSRGLLYKEGPLAGKDSVNVYYLTATHEDILTSPNLLQSGKMIDVLLQSVIKEIGVSSGSLLLGDRNAILVWLRSTGYGSDYPVRIRCRNCGESFDHEFNLAELDIKMLDEEPDEDGLFSYVLPVSKKKVRFGLMTGDDDNTIAKIAENKKVNKIKIDNTLTLKMSYMIKEIDGNKDETFIKQFIEKLPVADSRAFRKNLYSIEPGIIMEQDATCSSCNNTTKEVVPIQPNFFWPDIRI
jgi:hypothetical protein